MTMLQVRNLSSATHEELRRRASRAGMSLSDYVGHQLDLLVAVPSQEEFWLLPDDEWEPAADQDGTIDQLIVDLIRERRGPLP